MSREPSKTCLRPHPPYLQMTYARLSESLLVRPSLQPRSCTPLPSRLQKCEQERHPGRYETMDALLTHRECAARSHVVWRCVDAARYVLARSTPVVLSVVRASWHFDRLARATCAATCHMLGLRPVLFAGACQASATLPWSA